MIHALDAVAFALGDFTQLSAVAAVQRPRVAVFETGEVLSATAPDYIALCGALTGGSLITALYRGAAIHGPNLRWEVNGTQGDLIATSENGNFQVADLALKGAWGAAAVKVLEPPPEFGAAADAGIAANVFRAYGAIAHDLRTGARDVPDFYHAVRRHRLLATIEQAAATGQSQEPT